MYYVNGYKFHTTEWEKGKKTDNMGACVRGDTEDRENDWHRVLNAILKLEYPGESLKWFMLFNCEWYDPTCLGGTRKYNHYKIIEIIHTKRYRSFDPYYHAKYKTSLLPAIP